MSSGEGISSLWKKEDWWAVWIGFGILIFAVAMAGLGEGIKAPKIQRWAASPMDAFYSDVTVKVTDWPMAARSTANPTKLCRGDWAFSYSAWIPSRCAGKVTRP
ncbi:MAG: hypothetical protein ACYS1E_04085, partial [Planctomycetota bacterium]